MRLLLFALAALLLSASTALAQPTAGNPLGGLELLKQGTAMRSSSSDPFSRYGNADARPIEPGGTLELCELTGPGIINHIWFTISHRATGYPRLLTLRMYWDDEASPSVECPVGDFFVIGHGVDKAFDSLPVRVTSDGRARNCYWPMPFRESARITVTNESELPCDAFFWYVDWLKLDYLPEGAAYFHAMYRQEFPCVMGRDYLIADIEGRGHYVGTVQSVYHASPGWYGEGDDFWYIDGESEPRLSGTGTEDYFCDAWGFREQAGPYYGTPLWEGYDTGSRGTAYRFHIADPVPFERSLRLEIEHKGSQSFPDGTWSGFIERDDLISSVAFWYQLEPHKPWPALPPGPDRLPFHEDVLLEAETAIEPAVHSEHPLSTQDLPGMSAGRQLFFTPSDSSAWIEVPFDVTEDKEGLLSVRVGVSWDYGIWAVTLDGLHVGTWDLYSPSFGPVDKRLGHRTLPAGRHTIRFECRGKNPDSAGYLLGFDAIALVRPVYSRAPSVDLRELQVPRG